MRYQRALLEKSCDVFLWIWRESAVPVYDLGYKATLHCTYIMFLFQLYLEYHDSVYLYLCEIGLLLMSLLSIVMLRLI
jgi:hypothetical protein